MAEATIDPVQVRTEPRISPITADMGTIVSRAARRFGSKTALIAGDRTLTYQALDDLCDRVAGGLHEIGVRPGDRVSLYSPNRWEWVVAYHAALRAGAVFTIHTRTDRDVMLNALPLPHVYGSHYFIVDDHSVMASSQPGGGPTDEASGPRWVT